MSALHQLVSMNRHTSLYRGFTIRRLPRSAENGNHRYQIMKDGLFYGHDHAQAEAIHYIDQLIGSCDAWQEKLVSSKVEGVSGER